MPSNTSTSLHIAIQNGNMEIINMLLADGCESLYTRNAEGQTPLDLATAMNNEEIVRLLLEHGAGHVPPQSPVSDFAPVILDTEQRKKRIGFWTILVCVALGASTFFDILQSLIGIGILVNFRPADAARMKPIADGIILLFFGFPTVIAYLFCYFFWVFRLWEEIPRRFARTTPEVAAGLSLVPFFNWYWMFVALGGLYQDMNKVLEAYGHNKRFNTTLIFMACILWLVGFFIFFVAIIACAVVSAHATNSNFEILRDFFFGIWAFLWCVFTVVICWIIRRNVFEFMDIKRSLEG